MEIPDRAVQARGGVLGSGGQVLRRSAWWLVAITCCACIFYVSSLPGSVTLDYGFLRSDKVVHVLAFGLLSIFLRYALENSGLFVAGPTPYFLAVLIAASFGVTDEIHQAFVPGRAASFSDWTADAVGPAIFQGFLYLHARRGRGVCSTER